MHRLGTTTLESPESNRALEALDEPEPALALIWSKSEPERVGQVLLPGDEPAWFGRTSDDAPGPRLLLVRQRPGKNEADPLDNPFLSRRHLRIERTDDGLSLECQGRQPLRVGDAEFDR